jgi:hypothetical protein
MVRGAIRKSQVRVVVRRNHEELMRCVWSNLVPARAHPGQIEVQFTISPTGDVTESDVLSATIKFPLIELCIARTLRRLHFPKTADGSSAVVTYPFELLSKDPLDGSW